MISCWRWSAVTSNPFDKLPIAAITRQYLAYIKDASGADVELGADFLETASWLVLLKSRAILPHAPGVEAPSLELERALLDHDTLMRTAGLLRSRIDAAGVGPGSGLVASESLSPVEADERVRAQPTVQDALLAARRALAVAKAHAPGSRSFEAESYPVAAILDQLDRRLEALEPGRGVSTEGWFEELPAPEAQVTLLLALLELARLQREFCSGRGWGLGLSCSSGWLSIRGIQLRSCCCNAPTTSGNCTSESTRVVDSNTKCCLVGDARLYIEIYPLAGPKGVVSSKAAWSLLRRLLFFQNQADL